MRIFCLVEYLIPFIVWILFIGPDYLFKWISSRNLDQDGKQGYLIIPDQVMKVQLVAYDDVIQHIADDKLVCQIGLGDTVQVEE